MEPGVPVTESTAQHTVGWRDQLGNGCCRLPSIPHGANHRVHGLDEKLGPQVPPNFGRKGIAIEVLNSFCRCYFLVSSSSDFFLPLHCFVFLVCHYLDCCWHMIRIVTMQWCIAVLLTSHCMLSEISSLHVELISKLRRDSSWKDVKLAFTWHLWHSRCMKAYFTMTAHWIEIRKGALTTECMPPHQILDALPV